MAPSSKIPIGLFLQLAVDLKLIFFAESCEEGATSVHFLKKKLKGPHCVKMDFYPEKKEQQFRA